MSVKLATCSSLARTWSFQKSSSSSSAIAANLSALSLKFDVAWHAEVANASWAGPDDVKRAYPSASILDDERIVFNIKGNKYRVVVSVLFQFFVVYIKFIGTHAEYDKIDAATVGG